ncbi:MAG: AbrB/MazE/SpoVT family DNA-binding domain-containing protein [Asticcacaulis sp.]|uniref:AbrB/MazE/SpoVT family DNA-binding domain-containing protein n=1 Tax=Asticcacaulis sp. TaxID=1872648 RepID=UPI003F7B7CF2
MSRNRQYRSEPDQPISGVSEAPTAPFHLQLQIGADGRVLIPSELRRQMRLEAGGVVNAELVDGELRLLSPAVALERLERLFAPLRDGPSLVDELIADRRAEAARE